MAILLTQVGTKHIGFKEIRINRRDEFDFLKLLFPCVKIVFNYRVRL